VSSESGLDLNLRLHVSRSPNLAGGGTYRIMFNLSQSLITRCSNDLHDLDQLIGIISSPKQWVASDHLCHAIHQLICASTGEVAHMHPTLHKSILVL